MDLIEIIVNGLFVLLLGAIASWILVYRRLDRQQPQNDRYYRYHQVLIGLIALLAILLGVIIVLSSDPGEPDLILQGY